LSGANAIIERALELYFTSIQCEVWEKSLSSGWIKKLVLKGILFCTKHQVQKNLGELQAG